MGFKSWLKQKHNELTGGRPDVFWKTMANPMTTVDSTKKVFSRQGIGSVQGAKSVAKGLYAGAIEPVLELGARTILDPTKSNPTQERVIQALRKPMQVDPRANETQQALQKGFTFAGAMAPYGAVESKVIQGVSKIPQVSKYMQSGTTGAKVLPFLIRRAADITSGQILARPDEVQGAKGRLTQAASDVALGTLAEGAGALTKPVIKAAGNKMKVTNIAQKMDAPVPEKYKYHIQDGEYVGNRYQPNVKTQQIPVQQFEAEITGQKIPVSRYNEKGMVTKLLDPETGKLISWSTDNPAFAKRVQEGKLAFGLTYRALKPSELKKPPEGAFSNLYDKKARVEIDDSSARIKTYPTKDDFVGLTNDKRLADYLDHHELFKQYPELKNISVLPDPNMKYPTLASWDGSRIHIGSLEDYIMRKGDYDLLTWKNGSYQIKQKNTDFSKLRALQEDYKKTLMHEIQHAVQDASGFAPGSSGGNSSYYHTAGEIEARDVSRRINLSQEERLKVKPYTSYTDYYDPSQIIATKNLSRGVQVPSSAKGYLTKSNGLKDFLMTIDSDPDMYQRVVAQAQKDGIDINSDKFYDFQESYLKRVYKQLSDNYEIPAKARKVLDVVGGSDNESQVKNAFIKEFGGEQKLDQFLEKNDIYDVWTLQDIWRAQKGVHPDLIEIEKANLRNGTSEDPLKKNRVYYHGSDGIGDKIARKNRAGGGMDMLGEGEYITPDKKVAEIFGKTKEVANTGQNTYVIKSQEDLMNLYKDVQKWAKKPLSEAELQKEIPNYMRAKGYDSASIDPSFDEMGGTVLYATTPSNSPKVKIRGNLQQQQPASPTQVQGQTPTLL